jgi:hypothetical protein
MLQKSSLNSKLQEPTEVEVGAEVGASLGVAVGALVGADVGADVGALVVLVGVASPAIFAAAEPKLASSSAANAIVPLLQDPVTVPIGM